jgi:alkyl hydroperoxide reductase subunit AhpC
LKSWAESLGGINYPLLSDFWPHGAIADKYGVLRSDGSSERAIFVVDAEGIIRYIDVHDIDDQPSNEVLRKILRSIDPKALNVESQQEKDEITNLPKGGIIRANGLNQKGWNLLRLILLRYQEQLNKS